VNRRKKHDEFEGKIRSFFYIKMLRYVNFLILPTASVQQNEDYCLLLFPTVR